MATNLKHPVYDTDTHFTIDPVSREMSNTACLKSCLIQHDHNSERFTFEVPKTIEGHDMSKCDSIQVHYINIDSQTKEQSAGVYEVDDLMLTEDPSGDRIYFSWLISHNATEYVGSLSFLIRFSCYGEDGFLSYVWNTAIYSGISISNGIDNGEVIIDDYADILNEWRKETEAFRLLSLEQTQTSTESEGVNVWTATFADGTTRTFEVRNGAQGEPGEAQDLTNYVQRSEHATIGGGHGLVKLSDTPDNGLYVNSKGELIAYGGSQGAIGRKSSRSVIIGANQIDYAVKIGLTDNAYTLTDEEKTAIANWLGTSQIEFVSYVGTGTSGEANPCSITFSFAPKMIAMLPSIGGGIPRIITCDLLTTEYKEDMSFYDSTQQYSASDYAKKSADGKTIYWYVADTTDTGASKQYNSIGVTYTVFAVEGVTL